MSKCLESPNYSWVQGVNAATVDLPAIVSAVPEAPESVKEHARTTLSSIFSSYTQQIVEARSARQKNRQNIVEYFGNNTNETTQPDFDTS